MKHEISYRLKDALNTLKNKVLMNNKGYLYVINNFEIEEVIEDRGKNLFGKKRPNKERIYLTHIDLLAYNFSGEFLGYLREENYLKPLLFSNVLYEMRKNWKTFNKQLEAFGFKTIKKDSENESKKYNSFCEWYKENENRFKYANFNVEQIAYSSYLEGSRSENRILVHKRNCNICDEQTNQVFNDKEDGYWICLECVNKFPT